MISGGFRRNDVAASLPFQMILFYNILFACIYYPMGILIIGHKADIGIRYNKKVFGTILPNMIFYLSMIVEVARLYCGYSGNLLEQVSYMSAFMLLTIFPQFILITFLFVAQEKQYPWETVGALTELIFLVVELYVGHQQHKYLIKRATSQFLRLCQIDDDDKKVV
jgi:transmembrane protein 17